MQLTSPELITQQADELKIMPRQLAEFYIAIDDWIKLDGSNVPFLLRVGLCHNYVTFLKHTVNEEGDDRGRRRDISDHLAIYFTDVAYPFYPEVPSEERDNAYQEERKCGMYSNPHRLAWITKWADIARIQLGYPLES